MYNTTDKNIQEHSGFITPKELARLLNVNLISLYTRIRKGAIPVIQVGRSYYIPKDFIIPKRLTPKNKVTIQ